jgi:hypothetical protein
MSSPDSCLRRLFEASARCSPPLPCEAPFWMEARILEAWRRERGAEIVLWAMPLVRRAFVCAWVIIAVSTALSIRSFTQAPANELVIVDSAIKLSLMQ